MFFLARNPLKVIWGCVTLAVAIYCALIWDQSTSGQAGSPLIIKDGTGPVYYAQPIILPPEIDQPTYEAYEKNLSKAHSSFAVISRTGMKVNGTEETLHDSPELKRHLLLLSSTRSVDAKLFMPNLSSTRNKSAYSQIMGLLWSGRWTEVMLLIVGLIGAIETVRVMFKNFGRIGSKFSLGCCSLLMAGMDLIFSLSFVNKFGLAIDPLLLVEFGPLFIATVGFRKSYILARNIYNHRQKKGDTVGLLCGVEESMQPLLWEYGKEISLFSLFSLSDVSGLREFSLLSVFMLISDLFLLHTFYLGMIAYRMRLHAVREDNVDSPTQDADHPWRGRIVLLATVTVLSLYSLNILSTLSSRMSTDLNGKSLNRIIGIFVEPDAKVLSLPSLSIISAGESPFGAIDVIYDVLSRLVPSGDATNLKTVLQVSISLALPISLLVNYYLYRLLTTYTRKISTAVTRATFISPPSNLSDATDGQIIELIEGGKIAPYNLEKILTDCDRAVRIRRKYFESQLSRDIEGIPSEGFDFDRVLGRNCENVVGFVPVPVGIAGPIRVDGRDYYIPMSTTEGALIASASRGCKAISYAGGVTTVLLDDGMTRGPVVSMPNLDEAVRLREWIDVNFNSISQVFNGSSKHISLLRVDCKIVGKLVYLRFKARTGDAMGMNMLSKSSQSALSYLQHEFPQMRVIALSGNYCSDKKAAAINWIDGRGKSVTAEVILPADVIKTVLRTTAVRMAEVNTTKNLIGSMVSGSTGAGGNAHAANIIAAMFIALGQDAAQVVSSSSCLTVMEANGNDLYVSCTMPCLEVGVVGGGTVLSAQRACLDMLGLEEEAVEGTRAARLARIIVATVIAGEISLIASLSEGTLVKAHQSLNSSKAQGAVDHN